MGRYRSAVQDRLVIPAQVLLTSGTERLFRMIGRRVPAALAIQLVIDTGSKRSSLIPSVLNHLTPPPFALARVETSLASVQAELCWVRLEFPASSLSAVPAVAMARLPLPPSLHGFHGLIGRDLLSQWESFLYEGLRGRFTIRDAQGGFLGWLKRQMSGIFKDSK